MAWVTLRKDSRELTAHQLRDFCQGKLANYKIPRYVVTVDEFPTTVTGKVRKVQMRQQALDLLATPHAVHDARAEESR